MSETTTGSSNINLDSATIWAADTISTLTMGSPDAAISGQFAFDTVDNSASSPDLYWTQLNELAQAGWKEITPQDVGNNVAYVQATNYQGMAFYKVVNGTAEIIVANRATVARADLVQDGEILLTGTSASDTSAVNYYNAVAGWASKNLNMPFNIVETGYSLGGQEADYVMAAEQGNAVPETITFNALGIGPEASVSTNTPDAVNLVNAADEAHTLNSPYYGNTIIAMSPSETPSWWGEWGGLPPPGLSSYHSIAVMNNFLKVHPVIGGFDVTTYKPDTLTQGIYDQLASYGSGSFTSTYAQIFALSSGNTSTSSTTTNNQTETFTDTSTGNVSTGTGSMGDSITITLNADGSLSTVTNDGFYETQMFSATTGAPTSDAWGNQTGMTGTDTYNADGSSSGRITYANGSYAVYTDDGQGNISTDYYTAGGVRIRATLVHADGTIWQDNIVNQPEWALVA